MLARRKEQIWKRKKSSGNPGEFLICVAWRSAHFAVREFAKTGLGGRSVPQFNVTVTWVAAIVVPATPMTVTV